MATNIVTEKLETLADKNELIRSLGNIQQEIESDQGIKVSTKTITKIIKTNKMFKYKKVKKVPPHANSLRNQYMRQQFAIKLLDLLMDGKRILAIDETWFGETNYNRQSWQITSNQES